MQNPLFAGLTAYALSSAKSSASEHFQPRLLHLLKDLKMSRDWEDLPWYSEMKEECGQIPAASFVDLQADFSDRLARADLNQLLAFGAALRIELLVASAPATKHKLVNVFATYVMQWEDGKQVEYNCRPYNLPADRIEVPTLARIARMFTERFIETACERPGLDAYYEHVAAPFNQDAFLELMNVLSRYVGAIPAEQQGIYESIVVRLLHQFGPAPEAAAEAEGPSIEPTGGGGGFC